MDNDLLSVDGDDAPATSEPEFEGRDDVLSEAEEEDGDTLEDRDEAEDEEERSGVL